MGKRKMREAKDPARYLADSIIDGIGSDLVLVNLCYDHGCKLGTTAAFERDLLPWTREVSRRRDEKSLEMWFEALVRVQPDGAVRGFSVFLNYAGDLESVVKSPWTCGTAEISMEPPVLSVARKFYGEVCTANLRAGQRISYGLHP